MRKGIFVLFLLVAIVAIVTVPAGAKDEKVTTSQGQPFLEIWNAIKDLQNKLATIQLTPGPQGPKGDTGSCSCEVSLEEFNALKARVVALEGGDECYPVPETCNGIDDNCDGILDNGAPCGANQECLNGRCISAPSYSECTGWLDCAKACNSPGSCTFTCMGSPRGETQQDFISLMDCGSRLCGDIGGGTPFSECIEEYCAEQLQSCIGD